LVDSNLVDTKTNKTYTDVSGKPHPENINPELQKKMPEESKEPWTVCNCAEFKATNQALNDGAEMKDLEIHTVRTKTGEAAQRCKNCEETTSGAKNITSD
jgi:hypothetical protein